GALISTMARSTRFNQRPDTLMQDRHRQFAEPSCDARPDHTYGSDSAIRASTALVHFTSASRHFRSSPVRLEGVKILHQVDRVGSQPEPIWSRRISCRMVR